jgi:hypothetical protein
MGNQRGTLQSSKKILSQLLQTFPQVLLLNLILPYMHLQGQKA